VKSTRIELGNQLRSESQRCADKGNQENRGPKHPKEAEIRPHERPHQDSRPGKRNNDQQHDGPYPQGEALLFFE
jgi:hypothetical protein